MAEVTTETFCPAGWQPLSAGIHETPGDGPAFHIRTLAPMLTSLGDYETQWRIDLSSISFPQASGWRVRQWTVCHCDPLFADSFASGDTSAWSGTAP